MLQKSHLSITMDSCKGVMRKKQEGSDKHVPHDGRLEFYTLELRPSFYTNMEEAIQTLGNYSATGMKTEECIQSICILTYISPVVNGK